MGILAELELKNKSPQSLNYSTGWGTLKPGLGIIIFGIVVAIMWIAVRPLILSKELSDPLLQTFMPLLLWSTSLTLMFFGFLVLGYQKEIRLSGEKRTLQLIHQIWRIPIKKVLVSFEEINSLDGINRTPKRYRPENNLKGRSVGFWELEMTTKENQKITLDQAPKEQEIREIEQTIKSYLNS